MSEVKILKFIHCMLGVLWIYQGLFPKLLFISQDEITMWQFMGFSSDMARLAGQAGGIAEIIFGAAFIVYPHKILHWLNIIGMAGLLILVAISLPHQLLAAFNPVVMNMAIGSLSVIALLLMQSRYRNSL